MQDRVEGKAVRGIAKAQIRPKRPALEKVVERVAKKYRITPSEVLDRRQGEAYRAAVYLLRPGVNKPLREVAERAGVSVGRVSQIQTQIEAGQRMADLLARYELMTPLQYSKMVTTFGPSRSWSGSDVSTTMIYTHVLNPVVRGSGARQIFCPPGDR